MRGGGGAYMHPSMCVGVKRQLVWIGSFLLPCELQEQNSGTQVWQQAPLLTEQSPQP